jgi:hypothetical protein
MEAENIFVMYREGNTNAGVFALPKEFDTKLYAAEWAKKGADVDAKRGPQPIVGTNFGAVGWKPWLYPEDSKLKGRPCEVAVKNGTYVLLCRPRGVQNDVNAIYGNVSKQHLIREQQGESIAGQPVRDPGMLSDARIRETTGIKEFGGDDRLNIEMNSVAVKTPQVEQAPVATVET